MLFDADGVFQCPPPDLALRLALALDVPISRADDFILDLFRAEGDALTGARDLFHCVEPVLEHWGVSNGLETFGRLWHEIDVDHSVLAFVTELREEGVYCAVASNQQSHRAEKMSGELAYRQIFDAEFYSCHLGMTKPDEEYFCEVIRRAALDASRTLFIDDRIANIEAAKRVGLQAVQFAPETLGKGGKALSLLVASHRL